MDVFVRNVPIQATNKQLHDFFRHSLDHCGISDFHIDKLRDRPNAIITILNKQAGELFLTRYGVSQNSPLHAKASLRLHWDGKYLQCIKSKNEPSDFALQSIAYEASQRAAIPTPDAKSAPRIKKHKDTTRFSATRLECGVWDYTSEGNQLVFVPHYTDRRQGSILFGVKGAIILLGKEALEENRVDINFHDCIDITLGKYEEPSITFNLHFAPKLYDVTNANLLSNIIQSLNIDIPNTPGQNNKKVRVPTLNAAHQKVTGSCFVYRITLSDAVSLPKIHHLLKRNSKLCHVFEIKTKTQYPAESFQSMMIQLNNELNQTTQFGRKPFALRFQVDRLARNGILSPHKVKDLIPKIDELLGRFGLEPTLAALCRFAQDNVLPGPTEQAYAFSLDSLEELLETYATNYDSHAPDNPYELAKRHTHIQLVHKAVVTPAGIYLEGPTPEPANRVLREWGPGDSFLRVVFLDDNRSSVRYDPLTNQDQIYHKRFKDVLDKSIPICGQGFSFLGFSHSSLRSQSCWFMAPIMRQRLLFAQHIIKELGDFSNIRIPAKCAARIGQNFTDTNATVRLCAEQVGELSNVVRNGYDFSDGVGTISHGLLRKVWQVYGTKRFLKPTALQIRFQGYKGMVSLDSRLPRDYIMLRQNMKKYETSKTWDLEICGAGFRPLPMVLNRQFIKIFEDLGIQSTVFLDLQKAAMHRLQLMTASSVNTAIFLEEAETTKATRLSTLIRYLGHIGLDYHRDPFLFSVVELALISKLRDIKYRARIPVELGVTLYGIMDETGHLKEGEIFVVTEKAPEGGKTVLVGDQVVVTRSPALHPGDIQIAKAVDVPPSSPLRQLHNVVVFSKHGQRDLPSQLSGGDLDGDLYNIIWDPRMIPRTAYQAAKYPRKEAVELDRPVTRKDMSDFFVTFMESDLLGMISNIHLQLSDQRDIGTLDADCIKLAGLASTAVDFSKTGIPVDMRECPKYLRFRPDFMAPSPRVFVAENGLLDFDEEEKDNDDAFDGIDEERRPMRYYESKKVLGQLYRAINERQFVHDIQRDHQARQGEPGSEVLLPELLKYVQHWATQYGVMYNHHTHLAADIRGSYEESLANLMHAYEPTPHMPLTEAEIFSGHILGRQGGIQGKELREQSQSMRDRFTTVVEYARARITKGDQIVNEAEDLDDVIDDERYDEREIEALPRAIAAFEVAITQRGYYDRKLGDLKSFKYIAAAECLKELDRYRLTTFGSHSGLPVFEI